VVKLEIEATQVEANEEVIRWLSSFRPSGRKPSPTPSTGCVEQPYLCCLWF